MDELFFIDTFTVMDKKEKAVYGRFTVKGDLVEGKTLGNFFILLTGVQYRECYNPENGLITLPYATFILHRSEKKPGFLNWEKS
jgi:hypothetical protein